MLTKGRLFILLLFVALTGSALISFSGNNPFHRARAAGVTTMKECLDCHNGIMAKAITLCLGNECLYTKNHSLMHLYPPIGKERLYAPRSEIERAGCILENGKITCLSCHDLTKPPPHVIRQGDQLCLICHIDKKSL